VLDQRGGPLKLVRGIFNFGYGSIVLLFVSAGLCLIFFASLELWNGINPTQALSLCDRLNAILEGIGLLTIAVVALELGQTVLEEEMQRQAHIVAPTRIRRFLSRFMGGCCRSAIHRVTCGGLRACS
jgi:hypothetical protein